MESKSIMNVHCSQSSEEEDESRQWLDHTRASITNGSDHYVSMLLPSRVQCVLLLEPNCPWLLSPFLGSHHHVLDNKSCANIFDFVISYFQTTSLLKHAENILVPSDNDDFVNYLEYVGVYRMLLIKE